MNRMNTKENNANDMSFLRSDSKTDSIKLTDSQKNFIEKCALLIDTITIENLHLQPEMSFDAIKENIYKSGLSSIFPEYGNSRFFEMFLLDNGEILIQNPSDEGVYTQPYYYSNDIGDFEFVDNGSASCTLYSTESTKYFLKIIQEINKKSKNECLQALYSMLYKLAPDYSFKRKNVFTNLPFEREPSRMDFYIMREKGELDTVCFTGGASAFIGYEYESNNPSYKNRGWAGMTYKTIDFMGNIHCELLNETLNARDANHMSDVIISLFAHEPYKIYPHQAEVIYDRQPGGGTHYFTREISIDKCRLSSEQYIDKRCDPYMQNKIPLIEILQDIAEELCKLPDEKTVKEIINSRPEDIFQAVSDKLQHYFFSGINIEVK